MTRNQNSSVQYTTVTEDEGIDYQEISEIMSDIGYTMGRSSIRNYVISSMQKFVVAYAKAYDIVLTDEKANEIARSQSFQATIVELLDSIK